MARGTGRARATLRILLASGLGLALWAIALPAWASPAPFCDDRGATAMAPTPTLVGSESGVQIEGAGPSCEAEELFLGATLTRAHHGVAPSVDAPEAALASVPPSVPPATGEELDESPDVSRTPLGVRSRIERPPRG